MPYYDDSEEKALKKCADIGLHPLNDPLGKPDRHTDVPFSEEDERAADAIAWFLGTLFADVDGYSYWYTERTSIDEWRRVLRALRIHGLKIVDRGEQK